MAPSHRLSDGSAPRHASLHLLSEVGAVFLKLGCTSFGGLVAHLGYIHSEIVQKRHWVDDEEYADLVAFCQFLPGPASSQLVTHSAVCEADFLAHSWRRPPSCFPPRSSWSRSLTALPRSAHNRVVLGVSDGAVALPAFGLLQVGRVLPLLVVVGCAVVGQLLL